LIALVLFVAVIAQSRGGNGNRDDLLPASQQLFAQACEQDCCVVAPPRDIDGLQIENSGLAKWRIRTSWTETLAAQSLRRGDPVSGAGATLLDDNEQRRDPRVLWPQDYARPGTTIGAGSPRTVRSRDRPGSIRATRSRRIIACRSFYP